MSNIESCSMCSLFKLESNSSPALSVVFSPNGEYLASGSDNTIRLWSVWSGKCIRIINGYWGSVLSVVFSPDGEYLASGSKDCTIVVWRVLRGERIKILTGHSSWVVSVVFSLDGEYLMSGSFDKTIGVWRVWAEKESIPSQVTNPQS